MIRVDKNEQFIITVALYDEDTNQNISGQTVYYDIRDVDDLSLSPPASGVLNESSVESGIYRTTESVSEAGTYIIYTTCSGFNTNTEDLVVNEENIYDLTKQNRHYNIFVEDVIRTNVSVTPSQNTRNVPLNKTDYIITKLKPNDAVDWSDSATVSGTVYAWYKTLTDNVPYKMGGPN